MKTVRLTMAQALVRFLENQFIEVDGVQNRFVRGVFIIPGHTNDPEFCGTVVDAMSAESKYSVIPTFYDVVLKGRTTKDERDIPMLDTIRDHLSFDFAFAHLTALEMWTHFGGILLNEANSSYKPHYDKKAETYQANLERILDAYWDAR